MRNPEHASNNMEFDGTLNVGENRGENFGIKDYELSTSGFLFSPKEAFAITHELNKDLQPHDHIKLEVYPTDPIEPLGYMRGISDKLGFTLPTTIRPPHTVDANSIKAWQAEYPTAHVSRVHLPFSYNRSEVFFRPVYEREVGRAVRSGAWIFYFGAATNMKGIELAEAIGADITAHTNVVEGFAKDGNIDKLKISGHRVLAENEVPYRSPVFRGSPDRDKLLADPCYIAEHIVEKYNLDGLLLGLDHAADQQDMIHDALNDPKIQKHTKAIHLAGANHGIVMAGNDNMDALLHHIARTPFADRVSVALDLNPVELDKLSENERFQLIKTTFEKVRATQSQENR